MVKLRNSAKAIRGVSTDKGTVWLDPGEERGVEPNGRVHPDLRPVKAGALDHDEDGIKGGSLPDAPTALTGKNKADLLAIAKSEGVEVEDDMTNADIRAAIELSREA